MPSQGPKTTPMVSIVNQNVVRYVYFGVLIFIRNSYCKVKKISNDQELK